jgi:hypothetical protein
VAQFHPRSQIFVQVITPSYFLSYTSTADCILKYCQTTIKVNILKFLVLLALYLLESCAHAFLSICLVVGNQVCANHLIQFDAQMSNATNKPSHEPICKSIKQLDPNAVLQNSLSPMNALVAYN